MLALLKKVHIHLGGEQESKNPEAINSSFFCGIYLYNPAVLLYFRKKMETLMFL